MATINDNIPLGQAQRRGVFRIGDKVQLQDCGGRLYTVTLTEKGWFNTHRASFALGELIGKPEGTLVITREGKEFLALRPRAMDYTLSMPRGAAIIYPKECGQIIQVADIFTGARVFECGVGSGAMSLNLLNTIGEKGFLHSVEANPDFADIAKANVDLWWGGAHPAWKLSRGLLQEQDPDYLGRAYYDRAVIDLLDPWSYLDLLIEILAPGAVLCCYITTVTQMSTLVEALKETERFTTPEVTETIMRPWHVEGLAVRPEHSMIGHTGFLVTTRLTAPGSRPPVKKGVKAAASGPGQWSKTEDWNLDALKLRNPAAKKVKKVSRDAQAKAEYWLKKREENDPDLEAPEMKIENQYPPENLER